ncbi:MAG: MFS transporter [Gammaproteobacteria bacterium]
MNHTQAISPPAMTGMERRAVAGLASIAGIRMLGLFMLLPVLALYADAMPGSTPFLVGVSVGAYGITQALLQIPFGVASDRFGRRPVLLIGLAVFALGGAVAALSDHIIWVIAGRVIQGAGAVSAVLNALLADLTRPDVRTRAQAIFGASIGGSFMLSLMLGPMLAARIGVDGLFWLTCVLASAAWVAVAWLAPSTPAPGARAPMQWREVLLDRRLMAINFGIFTLHLIIAAVFVALPFVLRDELGIEPGNHWHLYLGSVVLSIFTTVMLIRGVERSANPGRLTVLAVLCLLVAQVIFVLGGHSSWAVFGGLLALFTGINFLEARLPAEVTLTAGAERRGAALGIYASAQFLGVFAGGASAGALLAVSSPMAVFGFAGAMALTWLLVRALLFRGSSTQ